MATDNQPALVTVDTTDPRFFNTVGPTVSSTTEVFCTLQFEGIHHWPSCPYEEVSFLRAPHRHMFWIKAWAVVDHPDRAIEFIKLKRDIGSYLRSTYPDGNLGTMSCEQLASLLIRVFHLSACEISEDGECGAIVRVVHV